jgi:hypothetical protein
MTLNSSRTFSSSVRKKTDAELWRQLTDPCHFHEHVGDAEKKACKDQEKTREPFIRSLLRTCMAAVKKEGFTINGDT